MSPVVLAIFFMWLGAQISWPTVRIELNKALEKTGIEL